MVAAIDGGSQQLARLPPQWHDGTTVARLLLLLSVAAWLAAVDAVAVALAA